MWIIIVLLSVIAVLILMLCVPLELAFDASVPGKPRVRFKLLWLFGLVGREMVGRFLDWFENLECGVDLMTQEHYTAP